jgi:3-phosphoshikimate 1-carboxyvinyltransferase
MIVKFYPSLVSGCIKIPTSKSYDHRDVILSLLTNTPYKIRVNTSDDIKMTYEGLKNILKEDGDTVKVVECKESGSTLRMLIPIALAVGGKFLFKGVGNLPNRSLDAYYKLFDSLENITYRKESSLNLPLYLEGKLKSGTYNIDGNSSSQFISGLLLALSFLDEPSEVIINGQIVSKNYINITIDSINAFNKNLTFEENIIKIPAGKLQKLRDIKEGDFSQVAFYIALSIINSSLISIHGVNENSLQGDKRITDIAKSIGTKIYFFGKELISNPCDKKPFSIDITNCPDLSVPLMILSCFLHGTSVFYHVERLYDKESNRLQSVLYILDAIGVKYHYEKNTLKIEGRSEIMGGVTLSSCNDHRVAMSLAVLSSGVKKPITVTGFECIKKSYPDFLEDIKGLGLKYRIIKK